MKLTKKKKEDILSALVEAGGEMAFNLIIDIIEQEPCRSPQQNKYYWSVLLKFFSDNTPEYVTKILQINTLSPAIWHDLLKGHFGIESTSFATMEQEEFTEYIENCKQQYCKIAQCSMQELNDILSEV